MIVRGGHYEHPAIALRPTDRYSVPQHGAGADIFLHRIRLRKNLGIRLVLS